MEKIDDLIEKLQITPIQVDEYDINRLKKLYRLDGTAFIRIFKGITDKMKTTEQMDDFFQFLGPLRKEMLDIAPFLSKKLNQFFRTLIEDGYYKKVAEIAFVMESCANLKTLEMLKKLLTHPDVATYLSHLEIYQIKKAVYVLSTKYDQKDELTYRIEAEMAPADMNWVENMDDM